jgi:hypothetical protein
MQRKLKTILLLLILTLPSFSQEEPVVIKIVPDSVVRFDGLIKPFMINDHKDEWFLPFSSILDYNSQPYDNSTIWMRTRLAILNSGTPYDENEIQEHFLLPLYTKHLEDSKFDPVRYALGMAQLSAVSYLAYRHIKKYGFLK